MQAEVHSARMTNGSKWWCFTLNNYTDSEVTSLTGAVDNECCQYVCWGFETGDSGTPHLQGYVYFDKKHTMQQVKRKLPLRRAHLETSRGTPAQAIAYCQKDGDFVEFGERPPPPGHRSDLGDLHERIKQGATAEQISDEFFSQYLRYGKGIDKVIAFKQKARTNPPRIEIYWGDTGTGKSRKAAEENPGAFWYCGDDDGWFDGYEGQDTVIFDDFDGSLFKLRKLLTILDHTPLRVKVKHAYQQFRPKKIVITSNFHPTKWYEGAAREHQDALMRRIREFGVITHFNGCLMPQGNGPVMPPATQPE